MTEQAIHANSLDDGLQAMYASLDLHQLAIYHHVTRENAIKIRENGLQEIPQSWVYKYAVVKGANRSGKTDADIKATLVASLQWPEALSMVVRKRKAQLKNSYLLDLKKVVAHYWPGLENWIILDEQEVEGETIVSIRSPGKPSKIIFRIEPDGNEREVEDSFKGYPIHRFTAEEATALKKCTLDQLQIRLSAKDAPLSGTLLFNPTEATAYLSRLFDTCWKELYSGQTPYMLPFLTKTSESQHHLEANYVADIKRQFKGDAAKIAAILEGADYESIDGKPVYEGAFFDKIHVRDDIFFDPNLPLIRAWDFGKRVGACGWWQLTNDLRLEKLAELGVEGAYCEAFADDVGAYTRKHFPSVPRGIEDYGDYAGLQEKDTGQTIRQINKRLGIQIKTKPFGNLDPQIDHIRKLLSEHRNGLPRISFHPRCTHTSQGYRQGYFFKKNRAEEVAPKPHKDQWYEHFLDSDRYGICHTIPIGRDEGVVRHGAFKAKTMVERRDQPKGAEVYDINAWLKQAPGGR
jgi:hypothetical protein